jgi:hypothetical protein
MGFWRTLRLKPHGSESLDRKDLCVHLLSRRLHHTDRGLKRRDKESTESRFTEDHSETYHGVLVRLHPGLRPYHLEDGTETIYVFVWI